MLDPKRIPIGKIKQAYELNVQEAEALLCALSPDGVFPYANWQKAHSEFWKWSAADNARLYKLQEPPRFPEVGENLEKIKYFPTIPYAKWLVDFLIELSKLIYIEKIEKGFDYVIGETYDGDAFPFKYDKESLFYTLKSAEKNIRNVTKISILEKDYSIALPYFKFIFDFFPDTVPVDKVAAVLYLHSCGYSIRREVKGLSRAIVRRIIAKATAPQVQNDASEAPSPSAIAVPRALWYGKTPQTIRDAMTAKDYHKKIITHILYTRCDITNKTYIAKLLNTYPKKVTAFLAETAVMNIVDS